LFVKTGAQTLGAFKVITLLITNKKLLLSPIAGQEFCGNFEVGNLFAFLSLAMSDSDLVCVSMTNIEDVLKRLNLHQVIRTYVKEGYLELKFHFCQIFPVCLT